MVESLSEREREDLQHVSELLDTEEIATEMYGAVNAVTIHLKSICASAWGAWASWSSASIARSTT